MILNYLPEINFEAGLLVVTSNALSHIDKDGTEIDIKVPFYINELDDNSKMYIWNEIEPIRLYKSD